MNDGLIPGRYAKALYEVAAGRGEAQKLYDAMKTLIESFDANAEMQNVMSNPFVAETDKRKLLETAAGCSDSSCSLLDDFISLLVQNRRISLANLIAKAYIDLYRKRNNIRKVEVTTASQLTPEAEAGIRKLVEKNLDGSTMEYSSKIDPSLIGGFTVNIDNNRLDASVTNQLKNLRLNLIGNAK